MDGFDEGGRVRAVSKSLELDKEAAVAELGLPVFGSAFFAEIEGVGGLRVVLHSMEVSWMVCSCIKVLGGVGFAVLYRSCSEIYLRGCLGYKGNLIFFIE